MVLGMFGNTPFGQEALGALSMRFELAGKNEERNSVLWRARFCRGDWGGYEPQNGYTSEQLRKSFWKGSEAYYKTHVQDNWTASQKRAFKMLRKYIVKHKKDKVFKENWWGKYECLSKC